MKKVLLLIALLLVILAAEYRWFVGAMECVVNRSSTGTVIDWATIKDCSY